MKKFKFGGLINLSYRDDHKKLLLVQPDGSSVDLIKRLQSIDELTNYKGLQINYHISKELLTDQELKEELIKRISGAIVAEYTSESYHYSSWTNGTDYISNLRVGGHDLFDELEDEDGKYILFEINANL